MSSSDSDEGSSPDLNCALCPLNITRSEFIPHRVHPSLGVGLCQDCYDDVVTPRAALSDDEEGEEGEAAEVDEDGFESRCCCCGDDGSLLCCESGGPAPDAAGSTLASAVLPQDSLAGAASESPSSSTATPGAGGGEGGGGTADSASGSASSSASASASGSASAASSDGCRRVCCEKCVEMWLGEDALRGLLDESQNIPFHCLVCERPSLMEERAEAYDAFVAKVRKGGETRRERRVERDEERDEERDV